MCISGAVGRNAPNGRDDVKTVQILLNLNLERLVPLAPLDEDGRIGDLTVAAIREFQRRVMGFPAPDGRVDPGGATLRELRAGAPAAFGEEALQGIMIHATPGHVTRYGAPLRTKLAEYRIDTPLRVAHFLAQVAHESAELAYSQEIASGEAYEGRTDLGNTQPGDGKRFKGRGLIQLTGRSNYAAYGEAKGIDYTLDANAQLLATDPLVAVDVSCWFWSANDLNPLADADQLDAVTLAVNGGYNGLAQRGAFLARAKFFLTR